MDITINITINGTLRQLCVPSDSTLLHVLRQELGLTGAKEGCGVGDCGACTVLVDGENVNSCIFPAIQADGKQVLTIEGLASNGQLHILQQAFLACGAVQCGFCTPGMLMSAYALLLKNKLPTEEEIRREISGNLCRCTGYEPIIRAVKLACVSTKIDEKKI